LGVRVNWPEKEMPDVDRLDLQLGYLADLIRALYHGAQDRERWEEDVESAFEELGLEL
jgi:hypothetical protein